MGISWVKVLSKLQLKRIRKTLENLELRHTFFGPWGLRDDFLRFPCTNLRFWKIKLSLD